MKLVKILTNPRVASAFISAISALICVVVTGCHLGVGEAAVKDLTVDFATTNYWSK